MSLHAASRAIVGVAFVLTGMLLELPTAHALTVNAVYQFGTSEIDIGEGVVAHGGHGFVCGTTRGTLPGQTNLGLRDAFVEKFDGAGTLLWTIQFGSRKQDLVAGCAANATGLYVVGQTRGVFPGATKHGQTDAFLQRITFDGRLRWARQLGGPKRDYGHSVTAGRKNVAIAGYTNGSLPGQEQNGSFDAFVATFSTHGRRGWIRQFGTHRGAFATGIAAWSGRYVAGTTVGDLAGKKGYDDAFVRKYTWTGHERWTRQFGSRNHDYGQAVAADATGLYVVGDTLGTLPGQTHIDGYYDAFLRKYTHGGDRLWTHQFGSTDPDANSVAAEAVAGDGKNVYPVGRYIGIDIIDPAVWSFSADGSDNGVQIFGTTRRDSCNGVALASGHVWGTGQTGGAMPGQTQYGRQDAFLADLS